MAETAVMNTLKVTYFEDMKALADRNGFPDWLLAMRHQARENFSNQEFPHTRQEEWRQTNIAPINNTSYHSLTAPPGIIPAKKSVEAVKYGNWTELVFIDGYFTPELSQVQKLPKGLHASSLHDAIHNSETVRIVEQHLNTVLKDRNAYTTLNTAFLQDGGFVHLEKNTVLDNPLHIIFATSHRQDDTASYIRNLFVLERCSQASIIVSYVNLADELHYLNNVVDEIVLGENAQLKWYKIVEEGPTGSHLATTEVQQARDSHFDSYTMSLEGKTIRNQLCVSLSGEGAICNLSGLYLNDSHRLIDNAIEITHAQPHCNSRIMYKGVLDGDSKAVFTGKVHVHQAAQKTDSDQLSNNLLLSDNATIHTRPQLEIYADDVKCTHGATIGSPPESIIFYFRSRGIDEPTARAMLTYGFAEEVITDLDIPVLSERLGRYVYDKFSP